MTERRHTGNAPTRELFTLFDTLHLEVVGERAVLNYGKDGKLLSQLCTSHGTERVKELLRLYFASDDEFICSSGYTVGLFYSQVAKLMVQQRRAQQVTGKAGYNIREAQAALGAMDGEPRDKLRRIR